MIPPSDIEPAHEALAAAAGGSVRSGKTPALSLILCSRNDEYMGNSRWRLETTLNYAGERIEALGRVEDVEILVTDWGSEEPLRSVVRLKPAAARIVSFITVPPALARAWQQDSPFPEVLALNAAARRACGRYIGRIDQDTLVGERFLRLFFEWADGVRPVQVRGVTLETALLFANRRSVPYHFAAGSPSLGSVTRFIRLFGERLSVWRENPANGHVFWTSYVGIWLAHRHLWYECGGYDERLIHYNWMEADMICRLRQKYAVVDLGELIDHDFYHLEHFHSRAACVARPHSISNPSVDVEKPRTVLHPNAETWGLHDHRLERDPIASPLGDVLVSRWTEMAVFASAMTRLTAGTVCDRVVIWKTVQPRAWRHKLVSARRELTGRPLASWPGVLWELWSNRRAARIRRMAGDRTRRLRMVAGDILNTVNLLAMVRRLRLRMALWRNQGIRRHGRAERERFSKFSREYGAAFTDTNRRTVSGAKTALVVSSRCPSIEGELCVIRALQLSGVRPVVLLEDEERALRPYYELVGVDEIRYWSEFLTSRYYARDAVAAVDQCRTLEDMLRITHDGVRVGQIAACTALRYLRLGTLDVRKPGVRNLLSRRVATSMTSAAEAQRILQTVRPDLVLTDTEYTPKGELFETCLEQGHDVIAYDTAHSPSTLMFKRYRRHNRDEHLRTLSSDSWAAVRNLAWTTAMRDRLTDELEAGYARGDWFVGSPALQSPSSLMEPAEVRRFVGLDPAKKTALIVPHMLWDAPMMWGKPLFLTYQDWLVETVAAACGNTSVNWVIKLHPAHVWKQADEGHHDEPAELRVLREHFGTLPAHIRVLPPDSPVSMFSLYRVMDYCLTVRGTAGIEAARLGVPVLTAGPARYSGLGFTVDSVSRLEYLGRVARIQDTPPLSDEQRELAERFAYGLFVLRPLTLESVTWDAPAVRGHGPVIDRRARIHVRTEEEWRKASDIAALAEWFGSGDEDFLGGVNRQGHSSGTAG